MIIQKGKKMIQAPLPANYGYTTPVAACPAQLPAEYNAIKINILDPKVNTPGAQQGSVYSYPQAPVYSYPQTAQVPVYYPPVQTQTPVPAVQQQGQVVMTQPTYYPPVQTQAPTYTVPQTAPQTAAPAPAAQTVPAPQVINQQTITQVPPSVVPAPEAAPAATATPSAPVPAQSVIDLPSVIQEIKSDDLQKAGDAIERVADIAQNNPQIAPTLLDTALMESLLGVIGKDTSTLEGPTEHQKDLRQQLLSGKQLSEADMAEANKISPLEMAERNKQYALFTTAILQNLLIDEFKKTNNMTPDIKDLPGMEQIVTTIKDNPNPMLRASGLAALAYNARPEYKPVMKEIFELSKQDADENVQKVAAEGLAKLDSIPNA